jgi:DNA-directed RNA polymerase specialized sigma24 family protein
MDSTVSGTVQLGNEQAALYGPRKSVHKLTPDEVTTLVERYEAGATVYELAGEFEINRVTVGKHLRRRGVRLRLDGLDEQQVEQALALYVGGWSLARVAEHLGVVANTVRAALLTRGVVMRDTQGRRR